MSAVNSNMSMRTKKNDVVKAREKANAELVNEVREDFERRKNMRRSLELQWQLNIDFVNGKQNNYISKFDAIAAAGKQFYWQGSEVYNHILPMVEARLARLSGSVPDIRVISQTGGAQQGGSGADGAGGENSFGGSEKSNNSVTRLASGNLADKIIRSAFQNVNFNELAEQAALWSELTGTAFYKVIWDSEVGEVIGTVNGTPVSQGDIKVMVCSPFEIYPDSLERLDVNDCQSIIHARTYPCAFIKEIWGQKPDGETCVVIERYEKPDALNPEGRLLIVAGDRLLYRGVLPFINEIGGRRGFPFVRQTSERVAGSFYGRSVIERAIPVQRAYNAVKNRKTELLNRLACGVLAVEEGSVDLESLENDGLAPGKVIVYRQGMGAPKFMDTGGIPAELEREEERLLDELTAITGGQDLARAAANSTASGVALQILTEQDNLRMKRARAAIARACETVAVHVLRLYKQFVTVGRVARVVTDNIIDAFYWQAEELGCL